MSVISMSHLLTFLPDNTSEIAARVLSQNSEASGGGFHEIIELRWPRDVPDPDDDVEYKEKLE